jgi:amidase
LKPYIQDDLALRPPQVHNVDERSRIETDPKVQIITDIDDVTTLHGYLRSGTFSAEDVVLAYIKR